MMDTMEQEKQTPAAAGPGPLEPADIAALQLHLRQREAGGHAPATWHADYLPIVERILRRVGLSETQCAPLREIGEMLHGAAASGSRRDPDGRWAGEHAKAAAEIAYLILTGHEESDAAQRAARKLVSQQIPLPAHGGDARGWKRLLEFRDDIRHGLAPEEVIDTYRRHLAELKAARAQSGA